MRIVRARVAVLLLALVLSSGLGTTLTQTASAAGTFNAHVCFVLRNGLSAGSQAVTLQRWNGSRYTTWRTGRLGANGCGTFFNVESDSTYYFSINNNLQRYVTYPGCWAGTHFVGSSSALSVTGSGGTVRRGSWCVNEYLNSPRC